MGNTNSAKTAPVRVTQPDVAGYERGRIVMSPYVERIVESLREAEEDGPARSKSNSSAGTTVSPWARVVRPGTPTSASPSEAEHPGVHPRGQCSQPPDRVDLRVPHQLRDDLAWHSCVPKTSRFVAASASTHASVPTSRTLE